MSKRPVLDVFEVAEEKDEFADRQRYGKVDNYEYEVPDDFEDEEIESDEAFNEADEITYARHFSKRQRSESSSDHELEDEEEYPVYRAEDDDDDDGDDVNEDDEDDEDDNDEEQRRKRLLAHLSSGLQQDQSHGRSSGRARVRGMGDAEGTFALPSGLEQANEDQLAALAASLGGGERAEKARKALRRLARTEATSAPLGTETGKRAERQIAYKRARSQLGRWAPQVHAEEATRSLDLRTPLAPDEVVRLETLSQPGGGGALEDAISSLLPEESRIEEAEALEMHKLKPEEVAARTAQLAQMRSLLFHNEIKAKRQARIKSRAYRKRLKKAREKNAPSLDELRAIDPEAAEEMAQRQEHDRVLERLTLRHRNTSKWVRGALRTGAAKEEGTRAAIQAQLDRHQQLRRKMGAESDDSDDDYDSSMGDNDEEDAPAQTKKSSQKGSHRPVANDGLRYEEDEQDDKDDDEEQDDYDYADGGVEEDEPLPEPAEQVPGLVGGRLAAGSGTHRVRASGFLSASDPSDVNVEEGGTNVGADEQVAEDVSGAVKDESKKKKKANATAQWSAQEMGLNLKKQLEAAPDDYIVPVGTDFSMAGRKRISGAERAERAALVRMAFADDDAEDEFAREKQAAEDAAANKGKNQDEDDEALAGWGAWTGEGAPAMKKKKKKRGKSRKQREEDAKAAAAAKKEKAPQHVFINSAKPETEAEFKTTKIPFPFTSVAQYEAAMALPLGPEWNSQLAVRDLSRPEVVAGRGNYLQPMNYVPQKEKKTRSEKGKSKRSSRPKNI